VLNFERKRIIILTFAVNQITQIMKNFIRFFASVFVLVSCSGREYPEWNRPVTQEEGFSHDEIVLGEQLQDPYSVENMTKALAAVHPSSSSARTGLDPTDFYVRFLPKDDAQMQELSDLGVELLDHPLDYRIVREGDWYHDPELPEGTITWQYAVVPTSFVFPKGLRYERLDDCYIAEHDPQTKSGDGIDWDAVEREAYRITGNEALLLPETRDGSQNSGTPQGRIAIIDPDYDEEPIGVKGVKVSCNSFVKFATCYTDDEGYYRMSKSFSTDIRYRLVFQNVRGFSQGINFILVPASVSTFGKHPASGFSIDIDMYSDHKLFTRSVINNAGYDYIEASRSSNGAIPAPPHDFRIWDLDILGVQIPTMMHHGVLIETMASLSDMPKEIAMIIKIVQQDVLLGLDGASSYMDLYRLGIHTFAQAGHFSRTDKDWWWSYLQFVLKSLADSTLQDTYGTRGDAGFEYAEISEMYAFYCEHVLCKRRYRDLQEFNGTTYWFYPQLLMYLDDRGLGLEKLAVIFTEDVTDMETLRAKLLSYYPQFKTVINEAYARYYK